MADPNPQQNPKVHSDAASPKKQEPVDPILAAMLHEEGGHKGPPRKRKRRWLRVLGVLVLILIALFVCAPYLAGTAPVRSFIVGQINSNLAGSVAIADYSVGWTGGVKASGIKVFDADKKLILSVPSISTKLSLVDAMRGNLDLGDTRIDVRLDSIVVDENGNVNLASIAKPSLDNARDRPPIKSDADAIELPNVKGKITVNILGGAITGAGVPAPISIEPSTILLDIPDINQPITDNVKLVYRLGNAQPSTVSLAGTIDAAKDGKINLATIGSTLKAQQKLSLENVDLSAVTPMMKKQLGPDAELGGIASGGLDVRAEGIIGISAGGELLVSNAMFAGAGLKDRLVLDRIAMPIQITRTVVDANSTQIKIEKLAVNTPLANVNVTGQVQEQALQRLAKNEPPGAEGQINLDIIVADLGKVTRALPKTLKLAEGVDVTAGSFSTSQSITIQNDRVISSQKLDVAASGTRVENGVSKPIRLSPIHLETTASALPNGKPMPAIRDLKLLMNSSFLTLSGGGESLAKIDVKGNIKLSKLRDELAQFSDLGEMQLSGDGDLAITTSGDPTNAIAPIDAAMNVNLTDVRISGATTQPINQPRMVLAAGGKILRDADGAPTTLDNASITFQAGEAKSPLIDVSASAKVDLRNTSVPMFDLTKLAVNDLSRAQAQFGGLVPALQQNQIKINSGAIYAQVAGSFDGKTVTLDPKKPLGFSLPNLVVSKNGRQVMGREDLTGAIAGSFGIGDATSANLTSFDIRAKSNLFSITKSGEAPIDVTLSGGGVKGNGAITVAADLKRLNEIAQAFGAQESADAKPASGELAGQLKSGKLDGTLTLAHVDGKGTDISFDGNVSDVTVTTTGKPLQNESIKLTANATSPDDLSGINVSNASLDSRFANAKVTNAKLVLGGGTWDLVQNANVEANVPDLAGVWTLMQAFSAPGAQAVAKPEAAGAVVMLSAQARDAERRDSAPTDTPEPLAPLQVTGGTAAMKLNVARDVASKTTTVTLSEMRVSNLGLARGEKSYTFDKDVTLFLKSSIVASDDPNRTLVQQISRLSIDPLSGDLGGLAKLSMPKPIEASGLGDVQKIAASGSIKLEGTIEALAPVLALLQGSDPLPYTGSYVTTQTIGTRAGDETKGALVSLTGDLTATDFTAYGADGKPSFVEKRVNIKNDIDAYLKQKQAIIREVTVDMPESQALAMKFSGRVIDWDNNRTIKGVNAETARLDLGYDLAKLWPIVKPMLDAETQESVKDFKIAAKYSRAFNLSGRYPVRPTWQESIRFVKADGSFAVEMLDTSGINLTSFDQRVQLANGVLHTLESKPATVNGGAMDLSNIAVVLTGPEPRISISKGHKLLDNVTINPLLGDSIGKFVNPVFTNTQRAKGLLFVTVDNCNNVALGDAMKTNESGSAQVRFSIQDMDIANPVGSLMLGGVFSALKMGGTSNQADTFEGQIKGGLVTLDRGRTTQKITMELIDRGSPEADAGSRQPAPKATTMRLTFDGNVRLSDLTQEISVTLPPQLIAKFAPRDQSLGRNLLKIFPEGIPLSLRGTTTKPQVDVGNILQKFLEGQIKSGLTGDDEGGGLGGILDKLGGGKKDEKKDRKKSR